ncbi:hypothetical protein [Chitinophaga filiformis]|uniref:PA14 domain-containing protein n=1 Tax=Chitinophaga filiformis TaxID=104663 RepID=A0ABY4ID86_CHIFI|nr:hypothetical protein [Chitinophaga filiformis]UPK72616.1 hypothetical protein MYF79_15085 [Chitinophaga filiformis]
MMIRNARTRVRIACFFLVLLLVQGLTPTVAWALTSGPVQPETKQFQAAGTSDMVDLFTGDFKYNIPLLDVGGYPVNLNYQSGSGMDDEASWVGLGWNLNVGAMNRNIRGIADDANGDTVTTESYMKPKITGGGKLTVRGEIFGQGIQGSLSLGIFCDNYTGYGAEIGASAGTSLSLANCGPLTPGVGAGVGLTSSTADGVSVTPNISASLRYNMIAGNTASLTESLSLGFNTREGLKGLTLSTSYSITGTRIWLEDKDRHITVHREDGNTSGELFSSSVSYNTPPFYPKSNITFKSTNSTYKGDIGGAAVGIFTGAGVTGYKVKREVLDRTKSTRAYGLLYAQNGSNIPDALMDFMREKDNPVIPDMNNLAVPIATPDLFSYSNQFGGGQVRLYRHSNGVVFDNETKDISDNKSFSAEYGAGAYFHGGTSVYVQDITNANGKWKEDNGFLNKGDFAPKSTLEEEPAYFQQVGEKHVDDPAFSSRILGEDPVSVPLSGKVAEGKLTSTIWGTVNSDSAYKKVGRQVRRTAVMYLTAKEASFAGLDTVIRSYDLNRLDSGKFNPKPCNAVSGKIIPRVDAVRKAHHISEMSVTGDDGKRMVYGIPVYNKRQDEYTFAMAQGATVDKNTNLATFARNGSEIDYRSSGATDQYYHKDSQPAYATSYLLTGILSPDYVDMTDNGITEDDRGTAFKFNYSKLEKDFHWRTPYAKDSNQAQFNRGLNADPDDDKGSFVYGEKELWYLHSIESKTMIAYFITEDRKDALGCNWLGVKDTTVKQQLLKEIRLYSKNDLTTPVKTVVFCYNYNLCPGVPNSGANGKLTLERVYFKYGSSDKGKHHQYVFSYNEGQNYAYMSADRWGTLKPAGTNNKDGFGDLRGDEYPYSAHDSTDAAANAGMWQLSEITLPTGGVINVSYESDDYAYVQDKKAMDMSTIQAMYDKDGNPVDNLLKAKTFDIRIDDSHFSTTDRQTFLDTCLNGEEYLYCKLFINVTDDVSSTNDSKYDFIPCYAKIKSARVSNGIAKVTFEDDTEGGVEVNPFASAAWQRMRLEYPRYAYLGYKSRITDDKPVAAIVTAIANATSNLSELIENFNKKAMRKKFASKVKLNKSFARIVKMNGRKLGGGLRVKKITMSDEWGSMVSGENQALYGQEYEYTTWRENALISSGVASYEPAVGGDENPLRQPVKYTQKVKWALDNFFYLEEPMAESLYPAPVVGYREVKVRNLGAGGERDQQSKTGWLSYEFYTAKEFPVFVQQTPIQKYLHKPNAWSSFFGGNSVYEQSMSQGYVVFLNDMHGKEKAEKVFNQSGQEISSTEYFYNAEESGGTQRLKNIVDVVDNTGTITKGKIIGRDIEMITDMRQSEMKNKGKSINLGMDVIPFYGYPLYLPHFPWAQNDDYRLFRSSVVMKTVQYYGLISKVVKRINGSTSTASYLLYDKYSGEPVLTQSGNEFDDPVYTMSIPAYWMYSQMGMAYKTLGTVFTDFATDDNGIPKDDFKPFLTAGDELINVNTGYHTWVINSTDGNGNKSLRLIEKTGRLARAQNGLVKICRSGYRNILSAPATAITSLENPIVGNKLQLLSGGDLSAYKVLNATAVLYDEAWGQAADCNYKSCPEGYEERADGICYKPGMTNNAFTYTIRSGGSSPDYGKQGAHFYNFNDQNNIGITGADYWRSKLDSVGIWLQGLPDGRWWGAEKLLTLQTEKDVFVGLAGTKRMRILIDGVKVAWSEVDRVESYEIWALVKYHLSAGKHNIRVEAWADDGRTVGAEIYAADMNTLYNGDKAAIDPSIIFSTTKLKGDPNVYLYELDDNGKRVNGNYICPDGEEISIMNGYPDCGSTAKGTCPPGYMASADGQACVPINGPVVDTDPLLDVKPGTQDSSYSHMGARFYDEYDRVVDMVTNSFWGMDGCTSSSSRLSGGDVSASMVANRCGRLNATGIWLNGNFGDARIGINTCLKVDETKTYYMGVGAQSKAYIYLDGVLIKSIVRQGIFNPGPFPYEEWKVFPVNLTAGQHVLTIEAVGNDPEHAVGVEVYNSTIAELKQNITKTIYTTAGMWNKPADTYVKDSAGEIIKRRYKCPSGAVDVCSGTFQCANMSRNVAINPYLYGYLGNWLPYKQMAWLTSRSGQDLVTNPTGSAGLRRNGYYEKFYAFWVYNNGWSIATNIEWVTSNTMTMYDKYSQDLENKDALNRYSAARYGFKSSLPVAVGANMRQREIFYDGFDDYKFNDQCVGVRPCEPDRFNIRNVLGDGYAASLDDQDAHSGNYSLKLNGDITLVATVFTNEHLPGIYIANNAKGEYYQKPDGWLGLRGFNPVTGNKYIFSAWVKDSDPSGTGTGITMTVNNHSVTTLKKKAVVEGWKLIEGVLDIPAWTLGRQMEEVTVVLNGDNVNVDDIRIFPYDGQLKTFTYDDKTQRVMAEMDENNYATFYEYDDEGTLIRVKKETERGIMTIKESRSAYRKAN